MSGCLDCGRATRKARCQQCRVEHNAASRDAWQDDTCPNCGADSPGGIRCPDCLHGGDQS